MAVPVVREPGAGAGRISTTRLRARWVVPVDRPPIADAAVLIGADGRIAELGPDGSVPRPAGGIALDLGDAILLPGLVNTHTHLELTGFEQSALGIDFRQWILGIRRLKQSRSPEAYLAAARRGLAECWAGGVTTIADTGDSGAVAQALREQDGSGIVYHEVFGPHPEDAGASFAELQRRLEEISVFAGGRLQLGVSPHAPYTVSGPLYARVASWARHLELPVAVHVAESPAETDFVTRGTGPFAEAWESRGSPLLDDPAHGPSRASGFPSSPIGWLDQQGVLDGRCLCIHAVQLSAEDIALLALRGAAVAQCPVSNAEHAHGAAPLAALRSAGLRVGVGTDSAASVGRLDLFRELRAAQALAGLSAAETVALATLDGARALGLDAEIGSLTPGKWGDVTALAVEPGTAMDPLQQVLKGSPDAVVLTLLAGRVVHRRETS